MAAFAHKHAKEAKKIAEAPGAGTYMVKRAMSFGWTRYKGSKAVYDMFGGEGPLKIWDGINGFIEALKDLLGLIRKVQDQFAEKKTVNGRVRSALKTLAARSPSRRATSKRWMTPCSSTRRRCGRIKCMVDRE